MTNQSVTEQYWFGFRRTFAHHRRQRLIRPLISIINIVADNLAVKYWNSWRIFLGKIVTSRSVRCFFIFNPYFYIYCLHTKKRFIDWEDRAEFCEAVTQAGPVHIPSVILSPMSLSFLRVLIVEHSLRSFPEPAPPVGYNLRCDTYLNLLVS